MIVCYNPFPFSFSRLPLSPQFKVLCFALVAVGCSHAAPYNGQDSGSYSNFGQGSSLGSFGGGGSGGYGDSGKGYSSGGGAGGGYGGGDQNQVLEVSPDQLPVQVHFRTASSRLGQGHNSGPQVEHASFQDEPHRVVHEVVKPVIQEVREIIQPYRRVTQEIRPVIEEVHTVVHKGENRRGGQGQLQGGGGGLRNLGGGQGGGQQYKSKA